MFRRILLSAHFREGAVLLLGCGVVLGLAFSSCQSTGTRGIDKGGLDAATRTNPAAPAAGAATSHAATAARRAKPQEEIARAYGYDPTQGEVLRWEEVAAQPAKAAPDAEIEVAGQFALLGAGGAAQVTERVTLLRGETALAELGAHTFVCGDGAWRCVQGVRLPAGTAAGDYVLRIDFATPKSSISGTTPLHVE